MFFDAERGSLPAHLLADSEVQPRWGLDSEYARLTDVLLCAPEHLAMLPCNSVTRQSIEAGLTCCPATAARQHSRLVAALSDQGVRCHMVQPRADLADLTFMRDPALMTPWGLVELSLAAPHRKPESALVAAAARSLGVPFLGRIGDGNVEGGDICIARPGTVIVGYSGERTNKAGARALATLFEGHGWEVIYYCFDPHFLHLDTQFTLIGRNEAVACTDVLEAGFLDRIADLGIHVIPASQEEVRQLGVNLLCIGARRVVSPADNGRINRILEARGYEVIEVELDQFVRCGGGVHCLTLPLARRPG